MARRYTKHNKSCRTTPHQHASFVSQFIVLLSLLFVFTPVLAFCQEQKKQPPPEFTSGYQVPTATVPNPRADIFTWVDVAILVLVMSLTAWFVLKSRTRREVKTLSVFSLLYFGFYRYGCVCSVGSIQNVALSLGGNGYVLPAAVGAFFVLPLLFALFFGRVFCATACPLGAIQDVVLMRPKRVPKWLDQALSVVPYLVLGGGVLLALTGSMFLFCKYDPFVGFFRLAGPMYMIYIGAGLLLISTVVGRPFCRWLCPYGVLLRWVSAFAKWRVLISPTNCVVCHLCADACPFGAIKLPTPETEDQERTMGKGRLAALVVLLPLIFLLGGWLGWNAGPSLALTNPRAALANRVWREEHGLAHGVTDASLAFRNSGKTIESLYADAAVIEGRFRIGGAVLGVWASVVVGFKLILLSIRRKQKDYEADQSACVACARCYAACPVDCEAKRLIAERGKSVAALETRVGGDE